MLVLGRVLTLKLPLPPKKTHDRGLAVSVLGRLQHSLVPSNFQAAAAVRPQAVGGFSLGSAGIKG